VDRVDQTSKTGLIGFVADVPFGNPEQLRMAENLGTAGHSGIRLVEAYWDNGQSKQRVVANSLGGAEAIEPTHAACWGPMLVARSLWREFGLESILDALGPKTLGVQKNGGLPLADRVLVLVANRLCRPGSEHALAQWLESDFVCGRDGKRILAHWKQQGRVRVDLNWLQEWYRTLDRRKSSKARNARLPPTQISPERKRSRSVIMTATS
jgi:hypothetical protein